MKEDMEAIELKVSSQEILEMDDIFLKLGWANHRRLEQELSRFNITAPQYMALRYINKHQNGCSMSSLADAAHQVMPTMTGIVDRLSERGLVIRERDQKDRRSLLISITRDGQNLLDKISEHKNALLAEFLGSCSSEERQQLFQLLQKYLEFFKRECKEAS